MALGSFQEGLVGDVVDGFEGAGAAIEGDEETVDRLELAGGDEDGDFRGADDALEVAAEVAFGKIRMLSAFPDDDEGRFVLELDHGIDEGAVALGGSHVALDQFLGILENRLSPESGDPGVGFVEQAEFCEEFVVCLEAEISAEVPGGGQVFTLDDVEDMDGEGEA